MIHMSKFYVSLGQNSVFENSWNVKRMLSPYFRNLPLLHITMTSFDMAIVEIHAVVS